MYKYVMIAREVKPIIIEAECGAQAEEIADAMIKSGEFKVWSTAMPIFDSKVGDAIEIKSKMEAAAESAADPDERDLEMGFDPYLGCYTDDC